MAPTVTDQVTAYDYDRFVAELTVLTRKYGVVIQSVGGVILADRAGEFDNVSYVADVGSGDLYPRFPCE